MPNATDSALLFLMCSFVRKNVVSLVVLFVIAGLVCSVVDFRFLVSQDHDHLHLDVSEGWKSFAIKPTVFLKTHKTGSSTVTTLFERIALLNPDEHHICLPAQGHIFSTFEPFNEKQVFRAKTAPFSLLVNHAVYQRKAMDRLVPNATYVTILRRPGSQWLSTYDYFGLYTRWRGKYTGDEIPSAHSFLDNQNWNPLRDRGYGGSNMRNGQLHDLGFRAESSGDVTSYIEKLLREFDVFLVLEHMDASLLLLSHALNLPWQYVCPARKGRNVKPSRLIRSPNEEEELKKEIEARVNANDTLLYNAAVTTLHENLRKYDPEWERTIRRFSRFCRRYRLSMEQKCKPQENTQKRTFSDIHRKWFRVETVFKLERRNLSNNRYKECMYYFAGDVDLVEQLRKLQSS